MVRKIAAHFYNTTLNIENEVIVGMDSWTTQKKTSKPFGPHGRHNPQKQPSNRYYLDLMQRRSQALLIAPLTIETLIG